MNDEPQETSPESEILDGLPYVDLWSDLDAVVCWFKEHGRSEDNPFHIPELPDQPDDVRQAIGRLNGLTMDDLMPDELIDFDEQDIADNTELDGGFHDSFGTAIEYAISSFDERDYSIFEQRFMREQPVPMDQVGERFGVSRERIRQIEGQLRQRIEPVFKEFDIEARLDALFTEQTPFMRLDQANKAVPELGESLPGVQIPDLWVIRSFTRRRFEILDGWIASPTVEAARKAFQETMASIADGRGIVPAAGFAAWTNRYAGDRSSETMHEWAVYCGFMFHEGDLILGRTQKSRAEAILDIEGRPMSTDELIALVEPDAEVRTFKKMLYSNDAIMRVDSHQWGLRSWGMKEFVSIRRAIEDLIREHGGVVPYQEMIDEVSRTCSVSASGVASRAARSPFVVADGVVRLESGHDATA
ncbi:sigma factor-like helix-turn-helix DNA-binding protein [Bifidobacterium saguinibicoloris]|uniref:sigma factor-like helix-turn-helix DNA-binding protein n=1 Tax=Bifidobacterium saguinibicoloris TaxID=2834433 RepID=UPI001C568B1F|nr:sigma factor-like helix-turn-helix DNA-binding protein [Bifidobacterium saguinibicoloris]MBW3080156.1 hypothetical protein [Bifidobacterium saguinibicoloris]